MIHVYVPSIQEWFEALVPSFLSTREVVELLRELVSDVTEQKYISSQEEMLCSIRLEKVLKTEDTLNDYGIINGDQFLLM